MWSTKLSDTIHPIASTTKITGLSKRTIYREMKEGRFPRPVQLSIRRVGWRESELNAWVEARKSA